MKKTICLAIGILAAAAAFSQCKNDRFKAGYLGYSTAIGYQVELGAWPNSDQPWGFLFGMAADNVSAIRKDDGSTMETTMYGRIQYRAHRFVQPTVMIGTTDFISLYAAAGIRFSAPLGKGKRFTMILEPQYGTRGAGIGGGLAIALE